MDTAPYKPLATTTIAEQLGQWAAENGIKTIHVFGVDVVYAANTTSDSYVMPRQFNDVVWSEDLLSVARAAYKAASPCLEACGELSIEFESGIKPGDPGFELPVLL
jgi:hypothetical protein